MSVSDPTDEQIKLRWEGQGRILFMHVDVNHRAQHTTFVDAERRRITGQSVSANESFANDAENYRRSTCSALSAAPVIARDAPRTAIKHSRHCKSRTITFAWREWKYD